jgi:hypothetical protein
LTCVYQNSQSAPRRPAPGLFFGPSASNTTNTSSEHSSIPVRASDEAAANVEFPRDQAISAAEFQQSTPLGLNPSVSVGGALDNATFSRLGLHYYSCKKNWTKPKVTFFNNKKLLVEGKRRL